MKIKHDFVTNSSSTGFIFLFKGDKRTNLFEMMVKYGDKFKLYNEYGPGEPFMNVWDLIIELDPLLSSNKSDPWYLPGPIKLSNLLERLEEDLDYNEKALIEELEREKAGNNTWLGSEYTKEYIQKIKVKLSKVKKAIKNDLDHYIEVSFGDNDGMISGGMIGMTMDYSGRSIDINQKDFVIIIENQH